MAGTIRDFIQANYYRGEMEIEEVIAGITEWFPEAREMYLAGEEIEMIIGAAMG